MHKFVLTSQPVEETRESLAVHWPSSNQSYKKFHNGIFFGEVWTIDIDCPNNNNCSLTQTNNSCINEKF